MAIKGIILDYSNTLVSGKKFSAGMDKLVKELIRSGIGVAVVSNNPINPAILRDVGITIAITASQIAKKKPSPEFVYEAAKQLKVEVKELIYIGDDPKTDAICAANAQILFYHAKWGTGRFKYGIMVHSPEALLAILQIFFFPLKGWAWSHSGTDASSRTVSARSVITSQKGSLYEVAKRVFTYKTAKIADSEFFFHTLVAGMSFYSDIEKGQIWTTYPSHSKGSDRNEILHKWLQFFAKEFHCDMKPLFLRHSEAPDSSLKRAMGGLALFSDQVKSVSLSREYEGALKDKTVVVLDDFTTTGKSLEWARNLLYEAGAEKVMGITLGKIGGKYETYTPKKSFNPYEPCHLSSSDFAIQVQSVPPAADADSFDKAFKAWSKWHGGTATVTIRVEK